MRRYVKRHIRHFTTESKHAASSSPKKANTVTLARKVMASVIFLDAKGILLIYSIEKAKIITSECCYNLLKKLDANIRENRPDLKKKNHFPPGQCTCQQNRWRWEN